MTTSSFIDSVIEINIYLISLSILWFLVRQKLSFLGQRILLISIPVMAMLIWYFKSVLTQSGMVYAVIPLEAISIQSSNIEATSSTFHFNIYYLYWIGVAVFLALFVIKISRVLFFFKDAQTNGSIKLTNSTNEDSFSFFNFIHLRADLDEEEKNVVLEHELIHYQKRHSFDLMIYEIYHSLFWFNPLMILMKKELVNIHEFEVDQEMYATHKTDYMRHLLSYALGSNDSHYLLTSPFYNKLTLKKRIKTMKNSNKTNSILLLLALPVLAVAFTVVSCQKKESIITDAPSPPTPPNSLNNNSEKPTQVNSKEFSEFELITQARKKAGVIMDASKLTKQTKFPGGDKEMYAYLGNNMKYPESAKEANIEGRIYIVFIVTETGEITEVQNLNKLSPDLDAEAIRVIKTMPNWTPAEKDGKTVAVQFTLPIMFKLQ